MMSKGASELMFSGELSNVTIEVGNVSIPAHKFVLASKSPVFRAMFKSEMFETNSSTITIADFSEQIVRAMLHTMYDPSVAINDLDTHNTVELFTIADKYQIQPLKALCCANLTTHTCVENAVIMLKLGDVYDETGALKLKALQEITKDAKSLSYTSNLAGDLGETLANELILYLGQAIQQLMI